MNDHLLLLPFNSVSLLSSDSGNSLSCSPSSCISSVSCCPRLRAGAVGFWITKGLRCCLDGISALVLDEIGSENDMAKSEFRILIALISEEILNSGVTVNDETFLDEQFFLRLQHN